MQLIMLEGMAKKEQQIPLIENKIPSGKIIKYRIDSLGSQVGDNYIISKIEESKPSFIILLLSVKKLAHELKNINKNIIFLPRALAAQANLIDANFLFAIEKLGFNEYSDKQHELSRINSLLEYCIGSVKSLSQKSHIIMCNNDGFLAIKEAVNDYNSVISDENLIEIFEAAAV